MFVKGLVYRDEFAHRVNANNTVDSICLHCFGTVASVQTVSDLRAEEVGHRCWQRAEYIDQIQSVRCPPASVLSVLPFHHFL
jgi:hypothetical protein